MGQVSRGTLAAMHEWDAATYDCIADPQEQWAGRVLARLEVRGDETALDAGCGSGRVTARLLERLPQGRVIALDRSSAMVAQARQRLAASEAAGRVRFVVADLGAPLPLEERVDAVFSNATFHWVVDHEALYRHLAAVLTPGGQLVADCGGAGNIATVVAALHDLGEEWAGPWVFPTPEEEADRLRAAGFEAIRTWLEPAPATFPAGEPFEAYLRTIVLRLHLERLPEAERGPFVKRVAAHLPAPVLDYVRLNIVARRAAP
jgi:trans-aconitate 2-methyltransferase